MKRILLPFLLSATALFAQSPRHSQTGQVAGATRYLELPMYFEPNVGAVEQPVPFLSRGPGYTLFLSSTQAVLSLRSTATAEFTMNLVGANPRAHVEGLDKLPGTVNYFLGDEPSRWQTGIPAFAKVKCGDVYPGVDLIYYGKQQQLEYDFVVEPNADPTIINLEFTGADRLELDGEGNLVGHFAGGTVRWQRPVAYQQIGSLRKEIPVHYRLKESGQVSFQIADYDTTKALIIDPALVYSTYLGGSGSEFDSFYSNMGITVDTSGNVYLAGDTTSINFPITNGFRSALSGGRDVFVTKLNSNGTSLVYSTYIGGSSNEWAGGIAVDSSGNAYITGAALSPNFPTRNAYSSANAGAVDAFVTKLGPFGTNLLYSTYLGGSGNDSGNAVAVDNAGNAYVAGDTGSLGTGPGPFPTFPNNAYQRNNAGAINAFVAKFNTTLSGASSLMYSTFLGGSTADQAFGIAIDTAGNAYVTGGAQSADFPTMNAFQSIFNGPSRDAFVTKLNAGGTGLIFSTFLGGNDDDAGSGIALDAVGRIYVVGQTTSTNFPTTPGAAQLVNGSEVFEFADYDAFVTVLQTNGASLLYSTYLGGSGAESFQFDYPRFGIAVDSFGNIYVTGWTDSDDFPITLGADQTTQNGNNGAFVTKINPAVSGPNSLIYSTFLGGSTDTLGNGSDSRGLAVAVDTNGNFYVAGITTSTNFPVTAGAFRGTNSGGYDAFAAKFSSPPDLSVAIVPSLDPVLAGSNLTYNIQVNNNGRSTFTGVTNVVLLATNFHINSISTSVGSYSSNNNAITFSLGSLSPNASATQTIAATALAVGFGTNVATLSYAGTPSVEPNTGNNTSTVVSAIFLRPLLKIARAGTNFVLFWTNTTVNFKPQSATNFSTNAVWSDTTNYPIGPSVQQFTNPASGPPRFYRLRI